MRTALLLTLSRHELCVVGGGYPVGCLPGSVCPGWGSAQGVSAQGGVYPESGDMADTPL